MISTLPQRASTHENIIVCLCSCYVNIDINENKITNDMKNFNLLSKMCSPLVGSQSSEVGFDYRLTVGSPSGLDAKWMLKLVSVLVLILTLGVGNAWGTKVLDFDFTSQPGDWPTSAAGSALTKTYTLKNTYTFALSSSVYVNTSSKYLMIQKSNSLGLPAIANYKLTGVEISNSSGCSTSTKVQVCNSTTYSDNVSGGAAKTLTTTSTTYTYSLSGTSANTVYYLVVTSANCQLVDITLTYTATSKFTVTFDAGTGTCASSSLTEGSIGSGITLPTATAPGDCGLAFMGWATESIENEDEEPVLYFAGNKFYPESSCTLYAVYVKDKAATNYYELISNRAQLQSGEQYIIEAYSGEKDYALKAAVKNTNYIDCKEITSAIDGSTYYEATPDGNIIWTITKSNETTVSLYNSTNSKYLYINTSSPYYLQLNASSKTFTLYDEDHGEGYVGSFAFYASGQSKYVYYNSTYTNFASGSSSDWNIFLYKRTYSGIFNTNPTCCTELGSINGDVSFTKTAYTITATWPMTEDGHETGYSVQLYDNNGSGAKGSAIGGPVAITGTESANRTCTFGAKTPVGSRLTANHQYFIGVTPTYSGAGDYCSTGTEVVGNTTTDPVYTVTYAGGSGSEGTMTDSNSPYEAGDEVTVLTNTFTKPGYPFAGWSAVDASSNVIDVSSGSFTMPSSNVTITATWGSALQDEFLDKEHGNSRATRSGVPVLPTPTLSDFTPVNEYCNDLHYKFIGWVLSTSVNEDGTLKNDAVIVSGGQSGWVCTGSTYYAVWAAENE